MTGMIDRPALQEAIAALSSAMDGEAAALNAADAKLGDGDLGVTMQRGMRLVSQTADELPDDLGRALMMCAQAFTRSSGSSFGTLLATGLMAMAKELKGRESAGPAEISHLVGAARDSMAARGKSAVGGKTVLDTLDAVARATEGLRDAGSIAEAAVAAADKALDDYRDKPATTGRARIFAERSIGLDDPGMLAMTKVVHVLAGVAK
ncbi:dihydroxyacetone kinase subunit L [Chelativorans sp. M5D2P16]|uniref:dihydroxyacetone kinase subunit L n=1 Tax=Chelativorans sp. M5D2P16 TaxID=3095678 RepID=UPI002ACAABAE|nr:dihydroxyacetone kinase subunit L [Chelativorans sp. M5D2P16]MDZ5699075.1 dihydroxyacetone kinase subunit L [Chelativorans sp. M5D2P16]